MRSLAAQIGMGYFVLAAVVAGVGAYSALRFQDLGGSLGRAIDENHQSVVAAGGMVNALERQEVARLRGDGADAFRHETAAFRSWLQRARAGAVLPEEPALLDSIALAYGAYLAEAPTGSAGAAAEVRRLNGRLLEVNQDALLATRARAEAAAARATRAVAVAAALAALVSLLAGIRFARYVTQPLRRLTASVRRIRRGHFDEHVALGGQDEVGELARAFNEMTERLQAYDRLNVEALLREKRTSEALVEAMPSPVMVTDPEGRPALVNGAAQRLLAGLAAGTPPDGEAAPSDGSAAAAEGAAAYALARRLQAADEDATVELPFFGVPRHFRPRRTAVDEGGVRLDVTLLEDVTPFLALDRARRDFLATVSHELRTPLSSLTLAADLLHEDADTLGDEHRELLQGVRGDIERLKRLVEGLLTLARLEAGAETGVREPVEVGAVGRAALDGLRLAARHADVALELDLEPLPPVLADRHQLSWVFSNLLANAVRHTPPEGRVALRGRAAGGAVTFEVTDTGPGLPPDAVDRVFEPFTQLGGPGARPGAAGLGLSIAQRVVEAHGGRIWAEHRPNGGGYFAFTLPALADA